MDKSTLLLSAIVLAVFGTSVAAGRPSWGVFTGIAIILLAAGLAAGALPMRSDDYFDERAAGQRISKSLVTLSSTAIVAIYAAGYYRTSAAAHKFDSQGEQRKAVAEVIPAAPLAAENPPPPAAPVGGSSSAAAVKKNVRKPAVPTRKADSDPAEPGESPASGTAANGTAKAAASPQTNYKDGTFLGWGSCRHGDIEASVQIQDGKIVASTITQCLTRYSCSWISPRVPNPVLPDLPREVVERQSAKVDYVSGATESSYAFADAITAALSKAIE